MRNTEQRSLRLSPYYLKKIDEVQEEKGLNFTDAIKHIISEFAKGGQTEKHLTKIFKQLSRINSSASEVNDKPAIEILDELQEVGEKMNLILNALSIIGSADSRTFTAIKDLFGEEIE